MNRWGKVGVVSAALLSTGGVAAGTWEFLDRMDIRPVLSREIKAVHAEMQVVGRSVEWLRYYNYLNRLRSGGRLSAEECADFQALARRLGARVEPC